MSDLISRQEAIDVIDKIFPVDPMKNDYTQGITCGAALATEYIEQLPSAQQWIPCSERLPKYDEEVLCFTTSEEMVVGHLEDVFGHNAWTTGGFASGAFDVLAWMPLPKPWRGEEDED